MTGDGLSPDGLARQIFAAMEANDRVFQVAGMREIEIGAGHAVLEMTVRDDMLNGHDVCHGGALFALADTTMAIAANSYNEVAISAAGDISFVDSAARGDVVRAEAQERSRRTRTVLYDVTLTGRDGRLIALFHGRMQRMRRKVVVDLPGPDEVEA
ncbi:MAG: hydroxyphenylacetyl-CoA thioesterase PaaI [Alphaproteobacteria bacterium]|jgi:acyl-CoA thioesterase